MSTPIHVLIVEDRPADAGVLIHELERAGYECRSRQVDSEADFAAYLAAESPDLILAEYALPHFNALRALQLLQEQGLDIPLIVVTGSASEGTAVDCMKRGAADYLLKDRLARLPEAVKQALQQTQLRAEKHPAEAALRESQAKTQALLNAIPDLIFRFSRDGVYLDYKADNLDDLAVPPEEFLGKSIDDILPELAPALKNAFEQAIQTGEIQVFEYRIPLHNVMRDFEARIVVSRQDETFGIVRDITERKRRERELEAIVAIANTLRVGKTRSAMMPAILDRLMDLLKAEVAVFATRDPATGESVMEVVRGRFAPVTGRRTPAGAGITGYVLATGRPILSNDLPNDSQVIRLELLDDLMAAACVPLIAEEQIIGALAISRRVPISDDEFRILTAVSDMAANAVYRAGLVETLEQRVAERTAELEAANERLKELDRLKSKFVSDVSHELRTPITNLNMRLYLLERDQSGNRAEHIAALKEQIGRFKALIENILDLSRLELGASKVTFAPVDLNAMVEQVVAAHMIPAQAAGLRLTFEPAIDLPPVTGERNQLAQVVTNLLINAINYTPAGEVRVRTSPAGDHVCLSVRDTGVGIDAEDLPHLFERFYRGARASRAGIPGSGLGLGIVKEIVDLHGGTAEVVSEVGKGTEFRIWLPVYTESST